MKFLCPICRNESLNILRKCRSDILCLVLHDYTHTHKHAYRCCCSVAKSCLTLCDCVDGNKAASLSSLSPWVCSNSSPLSWWCHPTISSSIIPFSSSIFPSIRVFSNKLVLHIRWPKCWSFSFSISPSNKYSELVSFRSDWFDLLAAQGTLKSFLQHHSLKTSFLLCLSFFMVQLSHPCMTTEKAIDLTIWTCVHKVISAF